MISRGDCGGLVQPRNIAGPRVFVRPGPRACTRCRRAPAPPYRGDRAGHFGQDSLAADGATRRSAPPLRQRELRRMAAEVVELAAVPAEIRRPAAAANGSPPGSGSPRSACCRTPPRAPGPRPAGQPGRTRRTRGECRRHSTSSPHLPPGSILSDQRSWLCRRQPRRPRRVLSRWHVMTGSRRTG